MRKLRPFALFGVGSLGADILEKAKMQLTTYRIQEATK